MELLLRSVFFDLHDIDLGEAIAVEVYEKFGRLDCVVNNAGAPSLKRVDFLELEIEALDFLYRQSPRDFCPQSGTC